VSRAPAWTVVCSSEQAVVFDATDLCSEVRRGDLSPIDDFYEYQRSLVPLGTQPALEASPVLGRLLLLGLVSGVEAYFRAVLSGVLRACPLCQDHASQQTLSIAAVRYYGLRDLGFGLMEGVSFATEGEIAKQTARVTGARWEANSSVETAVTDFESLSHFRHAAVHARGNLSPRNVHALDLGTRVRQLSLTLRLAEFHAAATICQNVVRAYNGFLFRKIIGSWIGVRQLTGTWSRDKRKFEDLFWLFKSSTDGQGPRNAYLAWVSLRPSLARAGGAGR
jgi:hypothetical protein